MSKRQTRSQAREQVFSLIFQLGLNNEEPEFLIEQMLEEYPESAYNLTYIKGTVYGVCSRREELTKRIASSLPDNRAAERLSKAVFAILLLAVYAVSYTHLIRAAGWASGTAFSLIIPSALLTAITIIPIMRDIYS